MRLPWKCGLESNAALGTPYGHDFTGDGVEDILWLAGEQAYAQLGIADGGFGPPQVAHPNRWGARVWDVAFADVNSDGTDDVVLCVNDPAWGGISLLVGTATGLAQEQFLGMANTCSAVAVKDVNGDGHPDLLITDGTAILKLRPGLASGAFGNTFDGGVPLAWDLERSGVGGSVVVGDFDEDGLWDLVTVGEQLPRGSSPPGVMDVFLGSPDGHWSHAAPLPTHALLAWREPELLLGETHWSVLGDPLVWPPVGVDVLHGEGDGRFAEEVVPLPGRLADVADADGDHHPDLLMDEGGLGVRVHRQTVGGWIQTPAWAVPGARFLDVDRDGRLDLVGQGWARALSVNPLLYRAPSITLLPEGNWLGAALDNDASRLVLWGNGTRLVVAQGGEFSIQPPLLSPTLPPQTLRGVAARLNADPNPDLVLVVSEPMGIGIATWLGTSQGLSFAQNDPGSGIQIDMVAVGDVTNDGLDDVILAVVGPPAGLGVRILPSVGDGTFGPAVNLGIPGGPRSGVVADFNGDGLADIVVTTSSALLTFLALPSGGFAQLIQPLDRLNPYVYAADMDVDGRRDLVSTDGDLVWVRPGNGDGTFQAPGSDIPAASGVSGPVFIMDVNGDGLPDMVKATGGVLFIINMGSNQYTTAGGGGGPIAFALGAVFGTERRDLLSLPRSSANQPILLATPCVDTPP